MDGDPIAVSIALLALSGGAVAVYHAIDPNLDRQRRIKDKCRYAFRTFQACYWFLVFVSTVYTRQVAWTWVIRPILMRQKWRGIFGL
jgi:hypothetical protein